ncbi:DASS family sodium-coupled anion symporter [Ammoniphilus sp. YIM 78166]|uniref:SLC13 family permease n=1 Tax=Ammoniphilus sp. YIM 78166 TaxID=1644106 RepID=UPI00142FBD74|nr:DASS family sodium-coupled anion symporter [Ammoniphilus sp. YIM 78166]
MDWKRVCYCGLTIAAGGMVYVLTDSLPVAIRITLGIFTIALILWLTEWAPFFVTSFLILFLEVVFLQPSLHNKGSELFFEPFFSPVVTLFLGGFSLSYAIHKYKLDHVLAVWLLKKSEGNPERLLSFLLVFSAAVSMWFSNTATTLLLMTLMLPIIKQGLSPMLIRSILLAIPIGSTVGGMATPVGTPPNAIAMGVLVKYQISFSFLEWMVATVPICVITLLLVRLGLSVLFPLEKGASLRIELTQPPRLAIEAWGVLVIFLITVALWLSAPFHHISEGVVALVPFILLFLSGLLQPREFKEMGWDTLFLVGGGMSLGVAMKESGLVDWVVVVVSDGLLPFSMLIVSLGVLTLVLSTVMSNTGVTSLVIPLAIVLGNEGTILSSVIFIALSSSLALALPVSTPANAIIFSTGYVRSMDMMKMGGLASLVGLLTLYLASVLYWPWL